MSVALTITAKGQITLRQAVLAHLGAGPGRKVDVALLPDGRVELRASDTVPPIARLRGALRRPGQRIVTLDEMRDAIAQGGE
ncbi:MAG: AbrB/MazE/SpoVT family DNA-binding domain-containing protein [Rhodospirillales bacterium]|nr:AbrB/MazE/SpoVT family DNA-binding domain-containing protein [Rhodospirillales bacterium]